MGQVDEIIFGKNKLQNIVSVEVQDNSVEIFFEKDGVVWSEFKPNVFWVLTPGKVRDRSIRLEGDLHYKYLTHFETQEEWQRFKSYGYKKELDFFVINNKKEAALVYHGASYFKGMKINDVSMLSFDIETTGLVKDETSRVLLISNTYRNNDKLIRKLFSCDSYESDAEMFEDWCSWVREVNPSILLGHNINMYDLPYMKHCADMLGVSLNLGRDESKLWFSRMESKFRKDGSQEYTYNKCGIYGREIIDTFFLAIKYDVGRKYTSYGLKNIIKEEDLEIEGRVFYEAAQIKDNWHIPEEKAKIKAYAEFDADDSLALYDLMVPPFFYMTQSVPKSFQAMLETASGSQINSILVRAYLQNKHSIPKGSDSAPFEGAISFGIPGIYRNVMKIDFSGLYPSIMRQYKVYDSEKDPKEVFPNMVEYFAKERLKNKKLAKETKDKYYDDMQGAQKIFANSLYGFLGAPGLNFNSPEKAAFITRKARELLCQSIVWATGKEYGYWKELFEEKCG